MEINFSLLKHQMKFLEDVETRYLALVAGYGAGKTYSFCLKGIYMAWLNAGHKGALLEPTNAMAADVLVPDLQALLYDLEIPHDFKASPYPTFTLYFEEGASTILVRSAENYRRLAGLNLAWFGVDECDTISKDIAWRMWRLLQSRLRAKAPYPQGFTTSTPEGFSFLYEYFVKEVEEARREGKEKTDRHIIHARTADNPFLEPDFIPSLLANYPPNLAAAYLEGQFVNLNSGVVYEQFDRNLNHTDCNLSDPRFKDHILHIGVDFNVNKTCGIVHILDGDTALAVDEICGQKNTDSLIKTIKHKYPNRVVYIYPDSSGKSEKTNASTTDIVQLQQAFGRQYVKFWTKNPPVRDRVGSMNMMFCNSLGERRYMVNTTRCPLYTEALEQQTYTKEGKPDKQHDNDHPVDAAGYMIYFRFPVKGKPSMRTQ